MRSDGTTSDRLREEEKTKALEAVVCLSRESGLLGMMHMHGNG